MDFRECGVQFFTGAGSYSDQHGFARRVRRIIVQFRQRPLVKRHLVKPRDDWREKVEAEGLIWHTADGQPYWDESAYYHFTRDQAAELENATAELYRLFLAAGEEIVKRPDLLKAFGIPKPFHAAIRAAWENEPPALNYGRFDLGYDGKTPPKLFEFNCDTPTSLLEAAVIQWSWKQECFPAADQFNSLHDALVARWGEVKSELPGTIHFTHAQEDTGEDAVTVAYLRDTAERAGVQTVPILIGRVGWDEQQQAFVDDAGGAIEAIFKLYPWEWLTNEQFAPQLLSSLSSGSTLWIEPIWKMIWSNKGVLAVLWELFPNHPNLLGAAWSPPDGADAVAKPLLAREGANVSIRRGGQVVAERRGDYGAEGYIYQELYQLPELAIGCYPVIGSWVIDGAPVGIGIREDGLITGNTARFVPHVVEA